MHRQQNENEFLDLDAEPVYDLAGRRITESAAEADADAIEAGDVEVDETRVLYPRGRPSLSEPRTHSPRVDTRVPRGIKTQLRHLAEQQHRNESDVVRDAIEEYLARH